MPIESKADFQGITRVGYVVGRTLEAMQSAVQAGITTAYLDEVGHAVMRAHGARSAPHSVYGCAAANFISINDEIVHGLPGARRLAAEDVVKLDVTAELDGYVADGAVTVVLPGASEIARRLHACATAAFEHGCAAATAGRELPAIGHAIEDVVGAHGFAVLRRLSGHGAGQTVHDAPSVPNYFEGFQRVVLSEGLVLTIEALIAERFTGTARDSNGWTLRTRTGCLSAHHAQTVIITNGRPLIVTAPNPSELVPCADRPTEYESSS